MHGAASARGHLSLNFVLAQRAVSILEQHVDGRAGAAKSTDGIFQTFKASGDVTLGCWVSA